MQLSDQELVRRENTAGAGAQNDSDIILLGEALGVEDQTPIVVNSIMPDESRTAEFNPDMNSQTADKKSSTGVTPSKFSPNKDLKV